MIEFDPRRVLFALVLADCVLLALFLAGEAGLITVWTLRRLTHFNMESNLPTWLSSAQLLLVSTFLSARACAVRAAGAGHWRLLTLGAGGFLFLSIDEASALHESVTNTLRLWGVPPWTWFAEAHRAEVVTLALYGAAGATAVWVRRSDLRPVLAAPGTGAMAIGFTAMVVGGVAVDAVWPKGALQWLGEAVEDSLELAGGSVLVYGALWGLHGSTVRLTGGRGM